MPAGNAKGICKVGRRSFQQIPAICFEVCAQGNQAWARSCESISSKHGVEAGLRESAAGKKAVKEKRASQRSLTASSLGVENLKSAVHAADSLLCMPRFLLGIES